MILNPNREIKPDITSSQRHEWFEPINILDLDFVLSDLWRYKNELKAVSAEIKQTVTKRYILEAHYTTYRESGVEK